MVFAIDEIDPHNTGRFGGKGTGLARMVAAGLPVPPAFVIGTDAYGWWVSEGGKLPAGLINQVMLAVDELERRTGKHLGGDGHLPLLVSVRSGAKVSMPGMMDTVLNLGITASAAAELARVSGRPEFAADTLVRFWRMFGEIVLQIDADGLSDAVKAQKDRAAAENTPDAYKELAAAIATAVSRQDAAAPHDPRNQLLQAVTAVFESWNSRRARAYRQHHGIPDELGTAVVVQAMVFGNLDENSGSGVAFSRNPNTGEERLYGEYLRGRQGEDLVSGSHTPVPFDHPEGLGGTLLTELSEASDALERMYSDAVDIEFTVEGSKLYLLQVRPAKRTAAAAVKIALALIDEQMVSPSEGLRRVAIDQLVRLLQPSFDPVAMGAAEHLAIGVGSSPGHSVGRVILDAERAVESVASGNRAILLRPTTSPQDIRGMISADGIVTVRGGALSHAAVVSRALDKPCIVGCESIEVDEGARTFRIGDTEFPEGTEISIDGTTGAIYRGILPFESASHARSGVNRLLRLADSASGCRYWVTSASDGVSGDAGPVPAGFGPVGLTDLLIAAGSLDDFVAAIGRLSEQPADLAVQGQIAALAASACQPMLGAARGLDVDIRLPNLGSARAQRLIGDWMNLAPQLFLPMGLKTLQRALIRGVAAAAADSPETRTTVLLGGVTNCGEIDALAELSRSNGSLAVGVSIQNVGALYAVEGFAAGGHAIWLDIMEITRSFFGLPSALSLVDEVFENYVSEGLVSFNPRLRVAPVLLEVITSATEKVRSAVRLGVECGSGTSPSLAVDMYRAGLRVFSVAPNRSAAIRLALGQITEEGTS